MPRPHGPPSPTNFRKPINFTPSDEDAERLAYLYERTALRGGALVRQAIKVLELRERASEAAERAGQAAREKATVAA